MAALVILLTTLAWPAMAWAADTIITPPLLGGSPTPGSPNLLLCYAVNTASNTQHISVSIVDLSGQDITQNPVTNSPLAPGTGTGAQASKANVVGVIVGYCKVTGDGPPKTLLVTLCNSARVGATDNCVATVVGQSQGSGGF
jgi:hypothetical protein